MSLKGAIASLVLFVLLQKIGISVSILLMLIMQPPAPNEFSHLFSGILAVAREICWLTALPSACYALLVVRLGILPRRLSQRSGYLARSAGLAVLFTLLSVPIAALVSGEWSELIDALRSEPLLLVFLVGLAASVAGGVAMLTSAIMCQLLQLGDRLSTVPS